MTKLKILVIDDSPIHQQAARQTLGDHNVTVATSYEEGFQILMPLYENYIAKGAKGGVYEA